MASAPNDAAQAGTPGAAGADGAAPDAAALFGLAGQTPSPAPAGNGEAPPAAAPNGEAGPAGAAPAADPDWYGQVSGDVLDGEKVSLRDWLKAAGVKDLTGLAKIARDNQVALRASGQVKLPTSESSAADVAAYHKAIGVPDDVAGYAMPEAKDAAGKVLVGDDGQPVPLNKPLLERLASTALKAGVPKAAYEALVNDFVQAQLEDVATEDATQQAQAQAKLKSWGSEGQAKVQAMNQALSVLKINRSETLKLRAALGADRAMDLFAQLGEGLAEDAMLGGGENKRFGMSGEAAQAEITQMISDPVTAAKVRTPGTAERARYERLQAVVGQAVDRKEPGNV
jgi:hypothetical protein